MKQLGVGITLIFILSILIVSFSSAHGGYGWRGSDGWGHGSKYGRMYNPKTMEKITGEVISVELVPARRGNHYGVHLMIKSAGEDIPVHLGPEWFMEDQDTLIEAKDMVEITGSRVTFDGKSAIIAAEVKKGEETLTLRDKSGIPIWRGWREGRGRNHWCCP